MSAMPAQQYAPVPAAITGWAVLAIGAVRLALPQRDVRQIELAADLKESAAGEGWEIGWLVRKNGPSWPAYSFDESLRFERPASVGRNLCVFIATEDAVHGILCDHVWSLASDLDLAAEPVPGCMTGLRSPATGITRFEDGVALVVDAATLADYFFFLQEPVHGNCE